MRSGPNDGRKRIEKWVTPARDRIAAHREEKPRTKAGQIRALLGEIEAALGEGQSLTSIRDWLEEEGVMVTLATLSCYRKRFRRRNEAKRKARALDALIPQNDHAFSALGDEPSEASAEASRSSSQPQVQTAKEYDPYAQARRALQDKTFDIRTVHGDGDPTGKNLV